jgi:hypothetical protein
MNRLLVAVVFTLGLLPNLASAVEIKNVRPCYGPFGATRYEAKCLPGDVLFMVFDIDGLVLDKAGKASYTTTLELLDDKGTVLFKNPTKNEVIPALGGMRMPGDLHVIMGPKQAPGAYSIRLTVNDHNGDAGKDKKFTYKFDVLKETFGFVGVSAPAVGFPGQRYATGFGLVNLKLDAKDQPSAELTIRVLDERSKPVGDSVKLTFPRDLPENTNLKEANFIPWTHPIFLNRPGRYTVEVIATDKNAKATATMSYPVTVIDVSAIAK